MTTQEIVDKLGTVMEFKFSVRRHHGDREGWMATDVSRLLERLEQETIELYQAIQNCRDGTGPKMAVILECADVANHCAMIADKFGMMEVGEFEDIKS
jgi:NTP pyrophosphatase (non-canonical NTP hydrolase)